MSVEQLSQITTLSGPFANLAGSMEVWLWDCGPEKPIPPKKPVAPKAGKEGEPEYELAKVDFAEELDNYQLALRKWKQDKIDFADWEKRHGGPIEQKFWSTNARDALKYDALAVAEGRQKHPRWHLSARTRGYERLPNLGLPEGMKPGHGHQAQLEREIAGHKEFVAALRADPVFGQEMRA